MSVQMMGMKWNVSLETLVTVGCVVRISLHERIIVVNVNGKFESVFIYKVGFAYGLKIDI